MKFSFTALSLSQLLAFACPASAMFQIDNSPNLSGNGRGLRKLLSKARRLEDNDEGNNDDGGNNGGEQNQEEMEAFLMDFSMKFMECIPDQVLTDADYNDHFGVVIFRLCPANSCSDNSGCKSGYADFAVDVGTYVDAFLTDQADNMNWDDKFDGDEMGECTQFKAEGGNDDGVSYYVGPGCTSDGKGVKLGLFEDQYCYQESETSFETISNGWGLPYSNGGLVSTQCTSCTEDGGLREMCSDLYENSPHRCEKEFDFKHYYYDTNFEMYRYGQDTTGCTKIDVMLNPKGVFSQGAVWTDAILAVMLLVVTGAGYAWYSSWWEEQKLNLEEIDDDEDSQAYHLGGDEDEDDHSEFSQHGAELNDSTLTEPVVAEGTMA
ncbi:unnamed protein product [Pseudo-nitzschia multistriata]|uniref:Niemann-Pick C1 N-terminal domain-containing protein n=1 Tax=Pseudo-nitzschia multistriata TaxID=183589 RepID=A0A448Z917_9STRA|nr:unnamed protein product [Pseudo-nitzschia multistriata]